MQKDSQSQLAPLTVALHWIVAVLIIGMLALGIYMDETEAHALYPIHKSIGLVALMFIAWRVVWRWRNGWPEPAAGHQPWERGLARVTHWVLIVGMLLFPLSGITMSIAAGAGLPFFGLELVAPNIDPANPQKLIALDEGITKLAAQTHGFLATLFLVLITLHVLGALKHHLLDKDRTLLRMLGR